MYELPALSTAVPCAVEFRLPPLPVGLKNVHLPVPITHIPLGTPPQLGSIESAGGGDRPRDRKRLCRACTRRRDAGEPNEGDRQSETESSQHAAPLPSVSSTR